MSRLTVDEIDERIAFIEDMLARDKTVSEIARRLCISTQGLYEFMNKHGIVPSKVAVKPVNGYYGWQPLARHLGLTQKAFIKHVGVSPSRFGQTWKTSSERRPTADTIRRVAEAFGMTRDEVKTYLYEGKAE